MRQQLHFLLASLALTICTMTGCQSEKEITKLTFDTRGGGDMLFSVTPANNGFLLHITRAGNKKVDKSSKVTAESKDLHALLKNVFSGAAYTQNMVLKPKGVTGTWTSVTIVFEDGSEETVDNVNAYNKLRILYDYAHAAL